MEEHGSMTQSKSQCADTPARLRQVLSCLSILALLTFGAVAQKQGPTLPTAPSDPDAIKGRWMSGGTEKSLTAGAFHRWHTILTKMESSANRGVNESRVWEFLLAASEADGLGVVVTDREIDGLISLDDPDLHDGLVARWKAIGVETSDAREYLATQHKITRLKDLLLNNTRVTTQEAFDIFKERHMSYKIQYALFAAEDVAAGFEADLDDDKLRRFWSQDRAVQNEFRTKNTISAEIIFLDPNTEGAGGKKVGSGEITRADALRYFQANQATLKQQIPPGKQHLLAFSADTPLEDIVTPFTVLEDVIRQKIKHGAVLEKALSAAHASGSNLETIASDLGLGYERVDKLDRASAIRQLMPFGYQAFSLMSNSSAGEVCDDVQSEKGRTWFFRLNGKEASRLPEFNEVKTQLRERYIERKATERCRKMGQDFIAYMRDQVKVEVADAEKLIDKRAEEETNRRVKALALTKGQDIARERMRARSTIRQELEAKKRELMPRHFDDYVAKQGLSLQETDYFEFNPYRVDRSTMTDLQESRMAFLTTNYYLRSLQVGQVTSVLLEDPHTASFLICKVLARRDPDHGAMGPVEYMQAKTQIRQTQENKFLQRFRFANISTRMRLAQERN